MIVLQLLFLAYALYTAEKYVLMKISSSEHRLLPVILVMTCLFNFYRVVECLVPSEAVFVLLEQLLVVQALYAIIHYKKDFLRMKFGVLEEAILFISLIFYDVMMTLHYPDKSENSKMFAIYMCMYFLVTVIMDIYMKLHIRLKKREMMVGYTLFSTLIIGGVALIAELLLETKWDALLIPSALFLFETQMNRLMKTGFIVDTVHLMKEQLFDNSTIATILYDENCYLEQLNEEAKKAFQGELFDKREKPEDDNYQKEINTLLAMENGNSEIEICGKYYRHILVKQYYRGRLRGYILQLVDITKEKYKNQLLETLKVEAEDVAVMKGKFLANMSHELRSPLHAIIGFCDVLNRQANLEKHYRAMTENIRNAGETLLCLVNSILDFSKLDAGKLELQKEAYNFEWMLQEILRESVINLKDKEVEVVGRIDTSYPRMLVGDKLRVREIIQNLMSNAVKYTKQGMIQCTVSCHSLDENKVKITVQVSDTGSGMDESQIRTAFEEYTSYGRQKNIEGTGLGLPIVKKLSEMMDGDVFVESDGESGSTFTATICQERADDRKDCEPHIFETTDLLEQTANEYEEVCADWIYPEARILAVDDMKVNLELFQEFADIWKIKVDMAVSGKEAIEMAQKNQYHIIFLDNMMPEMTGIETASIIRGFSDVPLFILTADISEETKQKSIQSGANELIEKPLRLEILKRVLEGTLPEELRETPDVLTKSIHRDESQLRIMRTYIAETEKLAQNIKGYWEARDMELFRIKVHGIKGTSKGVGQMEIGEQAEILEMAAKTDNQPFIERKIDGFL